MKNFIRETLEIFGEYKTSDVVGTFWQGEKLRVIGHHNYEKKVTSAKILVEEHFFYLKEDLNGKAYNSQILVFIGKTPVWGCYKKKFANFGIRPSDLDNALTLDLNMKAVNNGYERMTEEEADHFNKLYKAYADCDVDFFKK
jgi:hypothetical protein